MEFDSWYKQLRTTVPAPAPQTPQPPLPPPPQPPLPPQPPAGPGTSGINMESFLAGINFSRNYSHLHTAAQPQQTPFLPHTPSAFHPPPPPPAERLTMENIISLIRATQPDHGYHGQHYPGIPGLPNYPPYYGYGPRY